MRKPVATRIKAKAQAKPKAKPKAATEPAPEPEAETKPEPEPEAMPEAESTGAETESLSSHGWSESEAAALEAELLEADTAAKAMRAEQARAEQPQHAGALPVDADGYISREVWPAVMGGYFHLASAFTGLQTLNIDTGEDGYNRAALAVWDTCRETPYLDYLIKPGGKWMERAGAIMMFAVPVYMGCKAEIAARRAPAPEATPAGEDADPSKFKPTDFGGMA
jgi:hypothetical protein